MKRKSKVIIKLSKGVLITIRKAHLVYSKIERERSKIIKSRSKPNFRFSNCLNELDIKVINY